MSNLPKVTIIIPLYNEEKRLPKFLPLLLSDTKKYLLPKYPYEIIFVNDGSSDKTASKISNVKHQIPNIIKLIGYKKNQGKGYAIKKGVEKAQGEYIFFTDIDLSVDLAHLKNALKILEQGADAVIASRRLPESQILIHQNKIRETLGQIYRNLTRSILSLDVTDITCGFKGFKKRVARKIFSLLVCRRWSFDAELIYLLKKFNYKLREIPVKWKNNSDTKVRLTSDIVFSFIEVLKIRFTRYKF